MILDTTFLIDLMRGDKKARSALDRLESGSDPLLIPAPVLYELWEGIERSAKPIKELEAVERIIEAYPHVDLDPTAAKRAGRISARLIQRGEDVDDVDLLIAGIALERKLPVVTRNGKHFQRMEDLRVVDY